MTRPARLLLAGIAALTLLWGSAGCGSDASADPSVVNEITVTITGTTVAPAPDRIDVAKGQTVRLTVTSDTYDILHVHGYDKAAELTPGVPAVVQFVADQDGLFEVEVHSSHLQLCQLEVR